MRSKFVCTHNIFKLSCRDMYVLIAFLFKIDQMRLQNSTKRTNRLYELNTCQSNQNITSKNVMDVINKLSVFKIHIRNIFYSHPQIQYVPALPLAISKSFSV